MTEVSTIMPSGVLAVNPAEAENNSKDNVIQFKDIDIFHAKSTAPSTITNDDVLSRVLKGKESIEIKNPPEEPINMVEDCPKLKQQNAFIKEAKQIKNTMSNIKKDLEAKGYKIEGDENSFTATRKSYTEGHFSIIKVTRIGNQVVINQNENAKAFTSITLDYNSNGNLKKSREEIITPRGIFSSENKIETETTYNPDGSVQSQISEEKQGGKVHRWTQINEDGSYTVGETDKNSNLVVKEYMANGLLKTIKVYDKDNKLLSTTYIE